MKSRNWPSAFARACATISLTAAAGFAQSQPAGRPAIVLADPADAPQWQAATKDLGWQVIAPAIPPNADPDQRALALRAAAEKAAAEGAVDAARIYLAGRGDAAAMVFYVISRVPDVWAAGAALGGSPRAAIDSNRIFTANFTHVPVLWVSNPESRELANQLKDAGLNLEWKPAAENESAGAVLEWLAAHHRDPYPAEVDCETNSPQLARCYWIQMTAFDAAERNDVLETTRIAGASSAALDLGGFGYKLDDPGPGVLVSFLPEKYNGPLKLNDRIVALDGRPIADARQYQATMEKITEERPAAATVQRGKDRVRVETRIVPPRRDPGVTARVQARFIPVEKQIEVVSRTVTALRMDVPAAWLPAGILWNGLNLEKVESAGCWQLFMQKELLRAEKCK